MDTPVPRFAPILRDLTHELRNPLAAIASAADAVAVVDDDDERRALAAMILAETERLERLVANLLDMSRLDGGALTARPDWVALEELVEGALRECRHLLDQVDVTVVIPAPAPLVRADPVLAERILVNLLHNAVRHGAPPVAVTGAPAGAGRYALTVSDAGPGVDAAVLASVFEPFVHRDGEGLGLGLPLCRRLATAQDAELTHVDGPGGATFRLVLPTRRGPGG